MAATTTTVSDLNGLFKQVYGDKVKDLLPSFSIVTKSSKFVRNDQRSGSYFNQPVILQGEQGASYAASGAGAFDLNPSASMVMGNAQLLGGQIAFKATMDIESAKRATSGGASSFESATKLQIGNVLKQHGKRVELNHLYGQTDLGTVASSVNVNSTTTDITFTVGTWADAIWAGMTGAKLSAFQTTDGTLINANAALVVTKVTTGTRTLRVTGNSTDISDLDTWLASGSPTSDAAINFYGSRVTGNVYNEAAGIDKILVNTGSIFGIDAGTYDLWRANSYSSSSAALTQAKLDAAVALSVGKGLSSDVSVLVNPKTWVNLNTNESAKRVYDSSYSSAEAKNGVKKIVYESQNGRIEIISHPFVKQGEAFLLPFDEVVRPGACETTFEIPGQEGEYFTSMESHMGFYYKSYSNLALLINTPAQCVKLTDISNS